MQFEASYEKRSSRSRASSRSPLRSSLKRSASFSASRPHAVPLGGYVAPAPAPPPAPAPWVQGATRITYPAHAYPSASSYNHAAFATHNPTTTSISRYQVPGAYPDPIPAGRPASSYTYNTTKTTETKYEYNKPPTTTTTTTMYTYRPPSPPLEKPEVKAAIAHEQNLRMLTEQSHQETIKRQILEMEIAKAAVQRDKVRQEEEARQRMQRLYMISQQQQQQQMVMHQAARVAEEAHHRYHHHHGRSRSTHSIHRSRSRSRARSRSRSRELEYDEHRRSLHVCGKCHHRGHYSKECHHHGHHSSLLLHDGPRSSAPALLGPPSRGRRSRRGSVCSEEEYAVFDSEEEEGWWSDEYSERQIGRAVPADSGVLVMYAPGGGPASRRSSFRHVVGA